MKHYRRNLVHNRHGQGLSMNKGKYNLIDLNRLMKAGISCAHVRVKDDISLIVLLLSLFFKQTIKTGLTNIDLILIFLMDTIINALFECFSAAI